jgi:hypothetical protein
MSRVVQRVTLNLRGRPAAALEDLQARNDESQTEAVSRALLLRNWLEEMTTDGTHLVLRDTRTGEETQVVIL